MLLLYLVLTIFQQNFTSNLEGGNRSKAMKRLRVPPLGDKVSTCHDIEILMGRLHNSDNSTISSLFLHANM